ncbi:MAG: hypothetical protein ACI9FD_003932 [Gammaproteobacteria bacterium]|jgi:hypothetical protein
MSHELPQEPVADERGGLMIDCFSPVRRPLWVITPAATVLLDLAFVQRRKFVIPLKDNAYQMDSRISFR